MDDGDHAQRREEAERETGIAVIRARMSASRLSAARDGHRECCEDCSEPIPQERQRAVPGTTRCTICQSIYERRLRLEGN